MPIDWWQKARNPGPSVKEQLSPIRATHDSLANEVTKRWVVVLFIPENFATSDTRSPLGWPAMIFMIWTILRADLENVIGIRGGGEIRFPFAY